MGKAKFRPPTKSKPLNGLEWTLTRWLRPGSLPQTKFGDDRISGGFWVNMWNIRSFVTLFFPKRPGSRTSEPVLTQNGFNNVDSRIDVPFAVKIETFSNSWPQASKTAKIWHFWAGLRKCSLDFTFNTPYSSSELPKSVILNSQTGVRDSKYVVIFDPLPIGQVIRGMRSQPLGL